MPADYATVKAWRSNNKDKVNAQARRRRERKPEVFKAADDRYRQAHLEEVRARNAESHRERRRADPEGNRRRMAAFKARRELKLAELAGRPRAETCDVCKEPCRTVFDHCHKSDAFRGWICDRCNKVLGLVYDDAGLLRQLANYLGATHGTTDVGREAATA